MTKTELLAISIKEIISMQGKGEGLATDVLDTILGLCNEVIDND